MCFPFSHLSIDVSTARVDTISLVFDNIRGKHEDLGHTVRDGVRSDQGPSVFACGRNYAI